jgi:cell division septation protein DedD
VPVPEKQAAVPQKPAAPPKTAKAANGRYQVQLLAGRNEDEVRSAWTKLKAQNSDLLGSLSPVLAPTRLGDRGTYYRLRAGPLESEAKARSVCDRLSRRGASCIVIRPGS